VGEAECLFDEIDNLDEPAERPATDGRAGAPRSRTRSEAAAVESEKPKQRYPEGVRPGERLSMDGKLIRSTFPFVWRSFCGTLLLHCTLESAKRSDHLSLVDGSPP
jgi:hypothetical protein